MAEISKRLLDMLTEFMVCEIGSKAVDGITYTLTTKSPKDKELYNRYMAIKQEALKCGYVNNELFRVYEVTNGYIFDMDIRTAKQLTAEIAKSLDKMNNTTTNTMELIGDMPEQRRKRDLISLANMLKNEFKRGNKQLEVALFSRNATNKIVINGKGPNGELLCIKYYAYAIRHWDIELLNEKLLIPAGLRVSRIQPCEVLPSKTGVSFLFTLETVDNKGVNQW